MVEFSNFYLSIGSLIPRYGIRDSHHWCFPPSGVFCNLISQSLLPSILESSSTSTSCYPFQSQDRRRDSGQTTPLDISSLTTTRARSEGTTLTTSRIQPRPRLPYRYMLLSCCRNGRYRGGATVFLMKNGNSSTPSLSKAYNNQHEPAYREMRLRGRDQVEKYIEVSLCLAGPARIKRFGHCSPSPNFIKNCAKQYMVIEVLSENFWEIDSLDLLD